MNTEASHNLNEVLSTGMRLRKAREKFGLSQKAVAERLCLKVSTVRDIEEDKTPADLASTFLRGYIRSYAKLVNIPENELLEMMKKQTPIEGAQVSPIQSLSLGRARKNRDGWLMTCTWLVLFVAISLTGACWWQNHQAQQEEISTLSNQSSIKLDGTVERIIQDIPLSTDFNLTANESRITKNEASQGMKTVQTNMDTTSSFFQTAVQNNTEISSSKTSTNTISITLDNPSDTKALLTKQACLGSSTDLNELVMNFTADCWVELVDATGKKLFSGLQHKNSKLNLTGQAPYKLKIGIPEAVQIQFQGRPVDLNRFIRTK